jgi:spore coat polysaccharide biosynthesis protein SpsF
MSLQPRVVIICQARTGSTRLAGKILLPLAGEPLLLRFLERVSMSKYATNLVVATTQKPQDDEIVSLCEGAGYVVFRGHETDLLDRHFRAASMMDADVVVKIPTDCPLIDPRVIDQVIEAFLNAYPHVEYGSNLHPGTWPDGNDVEVMTFLALQRAWASATLPHEREHTTPWFWEDNHNVRMLNVERLDGQKLDERHRWTIDHPEDYLLIRAVFDALYWDNPRFRCEDVLSFLAQHPEVDLINEHLRGQSWYATHLQKKTQEFPSKRRIAS